LSAGSVRYGPRGFAQLSAALLLMTMPRWWW